MDQSEVAVIRAQMQAEYQAAHWALHGYAEVASHEFITRRMERIGKLAEKLELHMGKEDAMRMVIGVLDTI